MIRQRVPDREQARSMIRAAEIEIGYIQTLVPSVNSTATIIRSVYENFRMLGNALLRIQGIETDEHTRMINELIKLNVKTKRPIQVLDKLRTLRHHINYDGYQPSLDDLHDVLSILEACWKPILEEVERRVG